MITMIVDTFSVFYYEKMIGYMPSSFTDLVFVGEKIEVGLRSTLLQQVQAIGGLERVEPRRRRETPMS